MKSPVSLSAHERALYARQMRLPEVGEGGQVNIKNAKVLIIGAGGLGSPVALYLVAAGVGTIGIADPDKVDLSNLHRQIIHGFDTLGLPKTISAAESLKEINPEAEIILHPEGLTADNALELASRYDVVVDGADNFATRFLVADACVLAKKPLVHGSVLRGEGQVGTFIPQQGCYRCVYPVMPSADSVPTCSEAGVLGSTCGVIGSWMAAETLAILLKQRQHSQMFVINVGEGKSQKISISQDSHCPACGKSRKISEIKAENYESTHCETKNLNMKESPLEISVTEAHQQLSSAQPPLLIDVREPDEHAHCCVAQARLIPLADIPNQLASIPTDCPVLIMCHHGGRSMRATQFLRSKGYPLVSNIKGGIDQWSVKVDAQIPRY
jgi:sulfur-carrier protein adenylyltransferase/sulfurtransferase